MEPRQVQPESPYKIEKDDCRRIYRDVVAQALRDLGSYNRIERSAVINWMATDSFTHCCILAEWDEQWLLELFKALARIDESVRKQIATQCVHGLKFICRLENESGYLTLSNIEESSLGSRRQERSDPGDYENHTVNESKIFDAAPYGTLGTKYRYYAKKT